MVQTSLYTVFTESVTTGSSDWLEKQPLEDRENKNLNRSQTVVDVQWLYFQCCVEYLTRRQGRGQNGNRISLLYDYIRKGRGRNALLIKESTPAHWPNAERAFKVWHSENSQSFLSAVTTFTWERVRETERGTEGTKQLMIPYWSRSRNHYVVSEHLMSVMVKFSLMTNMTHGEDKK